jgi:hypothetical protein
MNELIINSNFECRFFETKQKISWKISSLSLYLVAANGSLLTHLVPQPPHGHGTAATTFGAHHLHGLQSTTRIHQQFDWGDIGASPVGRQSQLWLSTQNSGTCACKNHKTLCSVGAGARHHLFSFSAFHWITSEYNVNIEQAYHIWQLCG